MGLDPRLWETEPIPGWGAPRREPDVPITLAAPPPPPQPARGWDAVEEWTGTDLPTEAWSAPAEEPAGWQPPSLASGEQPFLWDARRPDAQAAPPSVGRAWERTQSPPANPFEATSELAYAGSDLAGQHLGGWVPEPVKAFATRPLAGPREAFGAEITPRDVFAASVDPSNLLPIPGPTEKAAPGFFSKLGRTVETMLDDPRTANVWQGPQLLGYLLKQGVKPDELKWTGTDDFLKQAGKVNLADVLDHVRANQVEVREIVKGLPKADSRLRRFEELDRRSWELAGDELDEYRRLAEVVDNQMRSSEYDPPRWGDMTLPGGESYQEVLLTLPESASSRIAAREAEAAKQEALQRLRDAGLPENATPFQIRQALGSEAALDIPAALMGLGNTSLDKTYRSVHWDEPNVLAHVRFDERVSPDGKKTLFINEMQSDWHQAARRYGYHGDPPLESLPPGYTVEQVGPRYSVRKPDGAPVVYGMDGLADTPEHAIRLALGNLNRWRRLGSVPSAPFAEKWHELALKRMIRWAAEHDFDRVAWPGTPEQVAEIERWPPETIHDKDKQAIINRYLQDLPFFANKFGKKFGSRPQRTRLDIPEGAGESASFMPEENTWEPAWEATPARSEEVWSLDVTPEMKRSVLEQGQPVFQVAPGPRGDDEREVGEGQGIDWGGVEDWTGTELPPEPEPYAMPEPAWPEPPRFDTDLPAERERPATQAVPPAPPVAYEPSGLSDEDQLAFWAAEHEQPEEPPAEERSLAWRQRQGNQFAPGLEALAPQPEEPPPNLVSDAADAWWRNIEESNRRADEAKGSMSRLLGGQQSDDDLRKLSEFAIDENPMGGMARPARLAAPPGGLAKGAAALGAPPPGVAAPPPAPPGGGFPPGGGGFPPPGGPPTGGPPPPPLGQVFRQPKPPKPAPDPERIRQALVRAVTDDRVTLSQEIQKKAIEARGGAPLRAEELAYELSLAEPMLAAKARIDEALGPVLRRLPSGDYDLLNEALMYADNLDVARATGNASRSFPYGLTLQESQARLAQIQQSPNWPKVQAAGREVRQFVDSIRARMRDAGLWSQELYDDLTQRFPNYVPTRILDYMADDAAIGVGKKIGLSDEGLRHLTDDGTVRASEAPLASVVRYAQDAERMIQKNTTFNAVRELRETTPDVMKEIARVVPPDEAAWRLAQDYPNLHAQVRAGQMTPQQAFEKVNWLVRDPAQKLPNDLVPLRGFYRGEKELYAVPKALKAAIEMEGVQPIPILGTANYLWKMAVTGRNLGFVLTVGPLRDLVSYGMRATAKEGGPRPAAIARVMAAYLKAIPDVFKGFTSGQFAGSAASEYLRMGGGMGAHGLYARTSQQAQQVVDTLRRHHIWQPSSPGDFARLLGQIVTGQPIQMLGERIELVPRVAAYNLAKARGADRVRARFEGEMATTNFKMGGWLVRQLGGIGLLSPFLNPVVQSGMSVARLARDHPYAFAGQVAALGALAAGLEAWNRADAQSSYDYDNLPQYVKDMGLVIRLPGAVGTDAHGKRRQNWAFVPLGEYAFAATLMRKAIEQDRRDWPQVFAAALGQASPIQGQDASAMVVNALGPILGTAAELGMNRDVYRDEPIATEEHNRDAGPLAQAVSGLTKVQPAKVEYALRNMGQLGAAAIGAGDLLGGKPRGDRPQDVPVAGGVLSRVLRDQTGGQTVAGRLETQPKEVRDRWKRYQDVLEVHRRRTQEFEAKERAIYEDATLTPQQKTARLGELRTEKRAALESLVKEHVPELSDREARDALVELAGQDEERAAVFGTTVSLPAGLPLAEVRERYYSPLPPERMAGLARPDQVERVRRNALEAMGREYGVEPNALLDAIKAQELGRRVPDLAMSEAQLSDAIGRWLDPPDAGDDPTLRREFQRRELHRIAAEHGVSPDDLLERIELRIARLGQTEQQRSLERAYDAAASVADPASTPKYVNPDGSPRAVGYAEEAKLDEILARYRGREAVPPAVRILRDAAKRGEAAKYQKLWAHEGWEDYQRWFGAGREMDDATWQTYRHGGVARYRDNPSPDEAERRDRVIRLVALLPRTDPLRRRFISQARRYKNLSNPTYRAILELDELHRRNLSGEIDALDASFEERTDG